MAIVVTIALWFLAFALLPALSYLAVKGHQGRFGPVAKRTDAHEALLAALDDWLGDPGIRQALLSAGVERSYKALQGLRFSLGDLNERGLHDVAERIMENRHVRHLIARRVMKLSGCTQRDAKKALRQLGQIED